MSGQETDDQPNDTPLHSGLQSSPYWQHTFLDKILPGLITNLLTASLIWLGAVATGYVRKPSPTVLANLVVLGGFSLIAVFAVYIRISGRLETGAPRAARYLTIWLVLVSLLAAGLYKYPKRGEDPYFVLLAWVCGPTVAVALIAEIFTWVKERSTPEAKSKERSTPETRRLFQVRHKITKIGVIWLMLSTVMWWAISRLRWGTGSPLPALWLFMMGAIYFLTLYRPRWLDQRGIWLLHIAAASVLVLLATRVIAGEI